MSKRLVHELVYDAPADKVAAMLADPAFREEVCASQRVIRQEISIEKVGDTMHVTIDQWQPTSGVPSFAKKFVGEETNIVQKEIWSSPLLADLHLTIPGKPGDMTGTAKIVEKDGVTTETVTLDIKVGIPLIAGKLEGLLADLLLKALKAENQAGRDYLAR